MRKQHRYRQVFITANGPGPWPCYGCDEPVTQDEVHIHHIDEDPTNDDPSNLASMHQPCHNRLHLLGRKQSDETRQKRSRTMTGRTLSPEHAAKARVAFKGRKHSAETRARMSATRLRLAAEKRDAR